MTVKAPAPKVPDSAVELLAELQRRGILVQRVRESGEWKILVSIDPKTLTRIRNMKPALLQALEPTGLTFEPRRGS